MRRLCLAEIHDQSWFPPFLRDEVTDALQAIFDFAGVYDPICGRLRSALEAAGTNKVLDLCSGAGGPWPRLIRSFNRESSAIEVQLTDKYPHAALGLSTERCDGVHLCSQSIDATNIPAELCGFRTIFSSFHHFEPLEARAILQDSVNRGQGIAIFESAGRHVVTIVLIFLIPLTDWILTPFLRPFRWSRLLFTYLIPVIPFVLWCDGIVSCLRAYSMKELAELTEGLTGQQYRWEKGEERTGFFAVPITYLVGYATPGPSRIDAGKPAR